MLINGTPVQTHKQDAFKTAHRSCVQQKRKPL